MFETQKIISDIFEILQGLSSLNHIIPKVAAEEVAGTAGHVDIKQLLIFTFIFLAGLGAVFGIGLAFAAQKFAVKVDPKIEQVRNVLPGANCGACGFAGCQAYAEAVVANPDVKPSLCSPGKTAVAEEIARITGKASTALEPNYARVMCQGGCDNSRNKFKYEGVTDCRAAVLAGGGGKSCDYGCLGYGTCAAVCPFDAITMNENNIPVIDIVKCTGCRKCEIACPKDVIEVLPASKTLVVVACHSKDRGVDTKKNCDVGCIACGRCVKVCPYDAASIFDNLSKIDMDKCTACGLCVPVCPTDTIVDFIPARSKAFILDHCNGCTICAKVCPVNAISGEEGKKHIVDPAICNGCGICTAECPIQAIDGTYNAPEVFAGVSARKIGKTAAA